MQEKIPKRVNLSDTWNENHRKRKCAFAWIKSIVELIYAIRCCMVIVSREQAVANRTHTHTHTLCAWFVTNCDQNRCYVFTVQVHILFSVWFFFLLFIHDARSSFCIRFHISNLSFYLCNFVSVLLLCVVLCFFFSIRIWFVCIVARVSCG